MKNIYFLVSSSVVIAFFFVDGWLSGILRWIICSVISTGTVGVGFNALVDMCANHPQICESVSKKFLSLPPKAKMPCPPGGVVL